MSSTNRSLPPPIPPHQNNNPNSTNLLYDSERKGFQLSITKYLQRQAKKKKKQQTYEYEEEVEEQQNHRKDVVYYTNHGIHVLRTLTLKRQSLTNGVTAFEMMCHSCTSLLASILHYYSPFTTTYSTTSKDGVASRKKQSIASSASFRSTALQEILKHFFLQYIHLRDGVILLTSGECRHTADAVLARSSSSSSRCTFPSQLTNPIHSSASTDAGTSGKRNDGYTQLYSSNCGYSGYGWDEFHNEDIGIKR